MSDVNNPLGNITNPAPAATTPVVDASKAAPLQVDGIQGKAPEADLKEQLKDPNVSKTEKQEIKKQLKKFNLVVNGKNVEEEIDLSDEKELTKRFQKSAAADLKFQEAAEVRKAAMDFIEELKKNPKRVLADPSIGIDIKKFAEEILNEQIKELEKSPEQRERDKLQKELEDLRQQSKDKEEALKKEQMSRMQSEQERILEADISAALDVGGIPKTARTVKAMAEMMMIALNNNIDLSARDIAPIIKNNTMSEFKEIINSLADDQLENFIGKEVMGRIRKKSVAKAKAIDNANSVKATGNNSKKEESKEPVKKMTIRDFLKV